MLFLQMKRCIDQHTVQLSDDEEWWECIDCSSRIRVQDHHITFLPIMYWTIPTNKTWDSILPSKNVRKKDFHRERMITNIKYDRGREALIIALRQSGRRRLELIAELLEISDQQEIYQIVDAFYPDIFWYSYILNDHLNDKNPHKGKTYKTNE